MNAYQTMNYVVLPEDDKPGTPYVGPSAAHNRFIAGDIVTHCQYVQDTSHWTIAAMHPARLQRLRRMLEATRPKYDCDTCRIHCNTHTNHERFGWANGKPTISTEDTRP